MKAINDKRYNFDKDCLISDESLESSTYRNLPTLTFLK